KESLHATLLVFFLSVFFITMTFPSLYGPLRFLFSVSSRFGVAKLLPFPILTKYFTIFFSVFLIFQYLTA
ncbi:MAG: hypothetical protein J6M30_08890, partial [Bacteroidales bacterium]|nr:hypothetical protein [Bacteroidales bacterium]